MTTVLPITEPYRPILNRPDSITPWTHYFAGLSSLTGWTCGQLSLSFCYRSLILLLLPFCSTDIWYCCCCHLALLTSDTPVAVILLYWHLIWYFCCCHFVLLTSDTSVAAILLLTTFLLLSVWRLAFLLLSSCYWHLTFMPLLFCCWHLTFLSISFCDWRLSRRNKLVKQ